MDSQAEGDRWPSQIVENSRVPVLDWSEIWGDSCNHLLFLGCQPDSILPRVRPGRDKQPLRQKGATSVPAPAPSPRPRPRPSPRLRPSYLPLRTRQQPFAQRRDVLTPRPS